MHATPTVDRDDYGAPVIRRIPATLTAVLALAATLAGCGSNDTTEPTSSAPTMTATKAPRNEVECVNINRAHNAWDGPGLLYTATQIADMNDLQTKMAMEAGKKYLDDVTGYDDQPSKELASAIAAYNFEIALVNAQVVIGGGVKADQAKKTEDAVAKVISSYRAWKSATCD